MELINHEDLWMRAHARGAPAEDTRVWREVFLAWREAHFRYFHQTGGDVGWAYKELPQLGFLLTAIYAAGGVALHEYGTTKKWVGDRRSRYPGRADLFAMLRGKSYTFEAKHREVRLETPGTPDSLNLALQAAWKDASHATEDADYRAAIAFVTLTLPEDADVIEHRDKHLKGRADPDCPAARRLRVDLFPNWGEAVEDGRRYVGVTVLMGIDHA